MLRSTLLATAVAFGFACSTSADRSPELDCLAPSRPAVSPPSQAEVAEHYEAVSEAEWNLELWLQPDGSAEILAEYWEAGAHESRAVSRYKGAWALSQGLHRAPLQRHLRNA